MKSIIKQAVIIVVLSAVCGRIVFAASLANSHFSNNNRDENSTSTMLKLVATVDGKSFFADNTTRNWTSAGEYCAGLGMELASITSKEQADTLQAAYNDPDFKGWYWTSGRDIQEPQQFVWNLTGDPIPNDHPAFEYPNLAFQTCIYYYSRPAGSSTLGYWPCTAGNGLTLCNT